MKEIIEIFKNRSFSKLFFANFSSQMGSMIGMIALTFYLLDRFSSQPVFATLAELMYSLPTLLIFFLVGVVADRLDRQKIAYYCDVICFMMSLLLIGAVYIGWMPLVFFFLFLQSGVQKFFFPAEHGLLQGTLSKEEYGTAAGLNQMVFSLFNLFGAGMAVIIYKFFGIYGALVVDSISFAISAILIRSGTFSESARMPNGENSIRDINVTNVLKDFKEGFQYIINFRLLLALVAGFFMLGIVNGGFSVMPFYLLKYKLVPNTYEEVSAVFAAVFGLGMLAGAAFASLLVKKLKYYQMLSGGMLISGAIVVVASFSETVWVFILFMTLLGFVLPSVNVAIGGWLPSIVDRKMMGRVQGWISPLMMLSQSITLGIIAVGFPNFLSIESLFWLVGFILSVVSIFYAVFLPRLYKRVELDMKELLSGA
ncbi:MFS transporter [Bacillus coahuilensis p1.1.43]|uniref:MFS transporter n=1 Tax=Bacillus coahuilensis p1.1.43 TaxID=1150625 RepID=A0A147KAS2_9BACI|nr:MFS transporter [Bacillus coahuilensis]KUP07878.1 MFS transporter [Bacillus coahuilensis p1.1.43]